MNSCLTPRFPWARQGLSREGVGVSPSLAARCKEGSFVSLQKPNPRLDIAGVTQIAVNRELGTQEGPRITRPVLLPHRRVRRSGGADRDQGGTCAPSSVLVRGNAVP